MKREAGSVMLILIVVVLALGAIGFYYLQSKSKDSAYVPQVVSPVKVAPSSPIPQPTIDPVAKASNPDDFSQILNDTTTTDIDNELNQTNTDLNQLNSQ